MSILQTRMMLSKVLNNSGLIGSKENIAPFVCLSTLYLPVIGDKEHITYVCFFSCYHNEGQFTKQIYI